MKDRLILELLTRGGMRIGEVLKLTPADIDSIKIILLKPKSGWENAEKIDRIPKSKPQRMR